MKTMLSATTKLFSAATSPLQKSQTLSSLPFPLKFEIKELLESFFFFHCSSSPFLRVSVANTSVVADLRGISCPKVA